MPNRDRVMPRHRADRELRAWRDGELSLPRRLQLRFHLARCARCRARVAQIDEERRLLTQLLASREPPPDLAEAWSRFQIRSRGAPRGPAASGPVATVFLAALIVVAVTFLVRPVEWASEVDWLLHPTPVKAKESSEGDVQFVERLQRLVAAGKVRILEDACCEDRDGEGPADDGLVILRVADRHATIAVLYEDLDGSRALTAGDLIRLVSRMADTGAGSVRAPPRLIGLHHPLSAAFLVY